MAEHHVVRISQYAGKDGPGKTFRLVVHRSFWQEIILHIHQLLNNQCGAFSFYFSHNSKDKPAIRDLASRLTDAGCAVWLDEDALQPGLPVQPQIEAGIRASRSVAVLVGAALYVGLYAAFRISSVGSLAMTVAVPLTLLLMGQPRELVWAAIAVSVLIVIKHIPNVRRLLRGEEGKVR